MSTAHLPRPWRAACTLLCERFDPADTAVWDHVHPGVSIDLTGVIHDQTRPMPQRVMAAVAQGLVDGLTLIPTGQLVTLADRDMRSVLDALAIARGSLPID